MFFGSRSPGFVVLNEPETSIHEALLEPLARHIEDASGRAALRLRKLDGESRIEGLSLLGGRDSEEDDEEEDVAPA